MFAVFQPVITNFPVTLLNSATACCENRSDMKKEIDRSTLERMEVLSAMFVSNAGRRSWIYSPVQCILAAPNNWKCSACNMYICISFSEK